MTKGFDPDSFTAKLFAMAAASEKEQQAESARDDDGDVGKEEEVIPPAYAQHLKRHRFELVELLGRGRTGRVFKAKQLRLGRWVAVKFCDGLGTDNVESKDRLRFERESRLLAQVENPNLPFVLTEGIVADANVPYYVMQYIPGKDLSEVIRERRLSPEEALAYARDVLSALAAAHRANVMHRDVSPYNVRINQGRAYLLDFSVGGWTTPHTVLTQVGEQIGRHDYLAPEQLRGALETDARTDVHQAGRLLFHMLSGRAEVQLDTLERDLPRIKPELIELIRTACTDDPEKRYQNAGEFLQALPSHVPVRVQAQSGRALCPNPKCPDANWHADARYAGPRQFEYCEDEYCGQCQTALVYRCPKCDKEIDEYPEPYCGRCRTALFALPRCKKCETTLRRAEFDDDTATTGCSACRGYDPDNDIPF